MTSCQEITEVATAYIEGTVGEVERVELERHITACESCGVYVEQLRVTRTLCGRVDPEVLSEEAREQLAAAFTAWRDARP